MSDYPFPVLIRPCGPGDLVAIHDIYGDAVLHGLASFELEPPSVAEMTTRWQDLVGAGFPYVVAEVGGAVAGYAYAGPYHRRAAYRGTVECSVYIHKDRHRLGLGRRLMTELITQCESLGFRQMISVIGNSNNTSSIELHRKLGFVDVGVLRSVGWKHGQWLDVLLLQRSLGEGDSTPPEA